MDGPDHYHQAGVSYGKAQKAGAAVDGVSAVLHLQAAQFHATMALAAAVGQMVQLGQAASPGVASKWSRAFAGKLGQEEQ